MRSREWLWPIHLVSIFSWTSNLCELNAGFLLLFQRCRFYGRNSIPNNKMKARFSEVPKWQAVLRIWRIVEDPKFPLLKRSGYGLREYGSRRMQHLSSA